MSNSRLADILQTYRQQRLRPDESEYDCIPLTDEYKIAEQTGLSLREIECGALEEGIVPERYSRNQKSFSNADQLRLLQSHVVIIGLGGLGGTVTEVLARIGVGKLTLVDGDSFDESNLNRQLLSKPDNLGKFKAEVAQARVQEINPAIDILPIKEFFSLQNSETILSTVDLAIDCLDTISDRFILEESCRNAGIGLVSAAIGGTSGQALVVFPGDPGLRQIYGSPDKVPKRGVEASMGTLPFCAVYMAAVECAEAVTILLGKPSELRNKLFIADVCDHSADLLTLPEIDDGHRSK